MSLCTRTTAWKPFLMLVYSSNPVCDMATIRVLVIDRGDAIFYVQAIHSSFFYGSLMALDTIYLLIKTSLKQKKKNSSADVSLKTTYNIKPDASKSLSPSLRSTKRYFRFWYFRFVEQLLWKWISGNRSGFESHWWQSLNSTHQLQTALLKPS